MDGQSRDVDVLVIGGGVVGCAILRELSRLDARVALLERRLDVGDATSKANSAIVHTGFDAPPGSLEARLLAEARELWPQVVEELHIPYLQTGAVMVALDEAEQRTIAEEIIPKAARNGVTLQPLTREEILDGAPYVNPQARGGVLVEGEGVIDPFWTTRAYAENAVRNGAEVVLGQAVTALTVDEDRVTVQTAAGATFRAALVINAAGLWADEVARLAGDTSFRADTAQGPVHHLRGGSWRRPDHPAGAQQDLQGHAGDADRVRRGAARPDGRGHRRQGRRVHYPGGPAARARGRGAPGAGDVGRRRACASSPASARSAAPATISFGRPR